MADKNFRSYADVSELRLKGETLKPGAGYQDTLKFSNADDVEVEDFFITGGSEDCIDINRGCTSILIKSSILRPTGLYGVTIKGGAKNINLRDILFAAHGKSYDIDIGNWSDQDLSSSTDITLINVSAADGKPVTVRVLWGDKPTIIGGNVKVTQIPKWLIKIYRSLRKRNLVS